MWKYLGHENSYFCSILTICHPYLTLFSPQEKAKEQRLREEMDKELMEKEQQLASFQCKTQEVSSSGAEQGLDISVHFFFFFFLTKF